MDHHCPWINNCVGFYNYKCFYLLLFYSSISCWHMGLTMVQSVKNAEPTIQFDDPARQRRWLLLFFGEAMMLFVGTGVTLFFLFHSFLVSQAMTTIEYCERTITSSALYGSSTYDRGVYQNYVSVLGSPWLWLLPVGGPEGDGLSLGEGLVLMKSPA
jgi:hypothetical protein